MSATKLSNVEIKARYTTLYNFQILGPCVATIRQTDIFFNCSRGRLKLRTERFIETGKVSTKLIFYVRPDEQGPHLSEILISEMSEAPGLSNVLTAAYGSFTTINKTRKLHMIGRTRVHLDEVDGKGKFLELEVVLKQGEQMASGREEAEAIMKALGLSSADLVTGSYADMK
jgi:predicted adenylyl cyclase CyaB